MRFWLLFIALFPVLLWQAVRTRKTALRLPDALGETSGAVGQGPQLRLLVIGESTTAGVGVKQTADALPAQLAAALAEQGYRVVWQADGVTGCKLADVHERLKHLETEPDLVVIATGVNDTTGLTPQRRWKRQLTETARLALHRNARVAVLALPPMGHFTALPQPLRYLMGLRSAMLDRIARDTAVQTGLYQYVGWQIPLSPVHLAEDGYHPSAAGYRAIARETARALLKPGLPVDDR